MATATRDIQDADRQAPRATTPLPHATWPPYRTRRCQRPYGIV